MCLLESVARQKEVCRKFEYRYSIIWKLSAAQQVGQSLHVEPIQVHGIRDGAQVSALIRRTSL